MLVADHFVQSFAKLNARSCEETGEVSQASDSVFSSRSVAGVENHAGGQRCGAIFPVPLHRAVLTAPNDHVRYVLSVRNIAWSEKPNFGQGIEARGRPIFYWRKLEAQV